MRCKFGNHYTVGAPSFAGFAKGGIKSPQVALDFLILELVFR